jgi:hypothetical protein
MNGRPYSLGGFARENRRPASSETIFDTGIPVPRFDPVTQDLIQALPCTLFGRRAIVKMGVAERRCVRTANGYREAATVLSGAGGAWPKLLRGKIPKGHFLQLQALHNSTSYQKSKYELRPRQ